MNAKRAVPLSVSDYLKMVIEASNKGNNEIAHEIGYSKGNIIAMFKTGDTKLPINKVGPLAKAVHIDPVYLLNLVMTEYSGETWNSINEITGTRLVSPNEFAFIEGMRALGHNRDIPWVELGALDHMKELVQKHLAEFKGRESATLRRIEDSRKRSGARKRAA